MSFTLEKFESYAYQRQHEMAMRELLSLLRSLDQHYGGVGSDFQAAPLGSVMEQDRDVHIWTRAASAATALLSDASLTIAPQWRAEILSLHRWFSALFSATPFRNADHVLRGLNTSAEKSDLNSLQVEIKDLLKFALLYTSESEVPLDLDALWEADKEIAASLSLVLISSRFLGSPSAHAKREVILPWLTQKMLELTDIESLPLGVMHDLYMHCSYADLKEKHQVKKSINFLIDKKLTQVGLISTVFTPAEKKSLVAAEKPVLLVVLEWFNKGHSIYRTHSKTIESARDKFHVVGAGYADCVDELTKAVFDEFLEIERLIPIVDQLKRVQSIAIEVGAAILYMPSVGMFPLTMWLANLRVAPLQIMALGHPATSHSDAIDFVLVEEDYVGDAACFSERLLLLPSDGMPYRPSAATGKLSFEKNTEKQPQTVNIAVCATTMKLNPGFLLACQRIIQGSQQKLHFHFLIGQNQGLIRPNLEYVVRQSLGTSVTIYPHQGYDSYMDVIAECDMFINPFPFGNTNGIVDTVSAGLVGVCKTGPEVHEHIDQALFERLNFPSWLVTHSVDDYVEAVIRLVSDHELRRKLSLELSGQDKITILFRGRPEIMSTLFSQKLQELLE